MIRRYIACVLILFALTAQAGETAQTVRDVELRSKPYTDAKTVGHLATHSQVEIVKRQAGWTQVKSDKASGWVRMLDLRFESQKAAGSSAFSGLKSLFNVATTGSSGHTVTTGVRGLSEEDLKEAKANPEELERLKGYAASSKQAAGFARAGTLKSRKVDYFDADREGQ